MWVRSNIFSCSTNCLQDLPSFTLTEPIFTIPWWISWEGNIKLEDIKKSYHPIYSIFSCGKSVAIMISIKTICSSLTWEMKENTDWSQWIVLAIASCLIWSSTPTETYQSELLISEYYTEMKFMEPWVD